MFFLDPGITPGMWDLVWRQEWTGWEYSQVSEERGMRRVGFVPGAPSGTRRFSGTPSALGRGNSRDERE